MNPDTVIDILRMFLEDYLVLFRNFGIVYFVILVFRRITHV